IRRKQELGMLRAGNVEEEDGILAAEQAQESAAAKHLFVRRKVTVMGLVTNVSRRRNLDSIDHLPVSARVRLEIHHRQKVRSDMRLIARPHVKHRFGLVSVLRDNVRRQQSGHDEKQQQHSKSVFHSISPHQLLSDSPTRGMCTRIKCFWKRTDVASWGC